MGDQRWLQGELKTWQNLVVRTRAHTAFGRSTARLRLPEYRDRICICESSYSLQSISHLPTCLAFTTACYSPTSGARKLRPKETQWLAQQSSTSGFHATSICGASTMSAAPDYTWGAEGSGRNGPTSGTSRLWGRNAHALRTASRVALPRPPTQLLSVCPFHSTRTLCGRTAPPWFQRPRHCQDGQTSHPRGKAELTSFRPPHRTTREALPVPVISSTRVLPAHSRVPGAGSQFFPHFTHSILLSPRLTISSSRIVPTPGSCSSAPSPHPDWLGQGFLPRARALAPADTPSLPHHHRSHPLQHKPNLIAPALDP